MATQGFFPATKPVASPVGLLNSDGVEVIKHPPSDEGWVNGAQDAEVLAGAFDLILADYCSSEPDALVQAASEVCKVTTYPFGVVAGYKITPGIGLSDDEIKSRVKNAADVLTQKAVEHELWTGDMALAAGHIDASYLAMHSAVDVSPGGVAVAPDHALSALEWALGHSPAGTGVIHMTRDLASRLTYFLVNDGDKLRTVLGTPVVVGSGYTGSAPAGVAPVAPVAFPAIDVIGGAPTSAWMYATGPVSVHLGSVQYIGERRDHTTNERTALAGRPATVYWDPSAHFAAHADLSLVIG